MSYTVGLDFGTHQTKVCIENATNPTQKIYEFLEFKNKNNEVTVLFPSIVQINEDETISYGFIDIPKDKNLVNKEELKEEIKNKPLLILPEKPIKPEYPAKPSVQVSKEKIGWIEQLKQILFKNESNKKSSILIWENECNKLDAEYEAHYNLWQKETKKSTSIYDKELVLWEKKKIDFFKQIIQINNENKNLSKNNLQFRYFKLASFSNSFNWNHSINSDNICVWYITNIIFTLQEKLGENFFLQMGIPSGLHKNHLESQKNKAYRILIAAYKLVDFYKSKADFLNEKYTTLLERTKLNSYSIAEINEYGLNVMPEAYAVLTSITQQKRLENGMSILVDIGGGTTDIAFFTIDNNQPDIHAVISFPKGLNYIFEQQLKLNSNLSIADMQAIFFEKEGDITIFQSSITSYKNELICEVKRMLTTIQQSFDQRFCFHKLPSSSLRDALKNRPVIFSGGGSIYESMRLKILDFTDIKLINKNLLNIPFILNNEIDDKLFTILATSFGLSIPLEDEIQITEIENVFNHIITKNSTDSDYTYEHGLTDI